MSSSEQLNNKVNISALVPALKQGNPAAWERFVRYMSPRAIRYFCAHGVDSHTAEDLAQETFLRAVRSIKCFRGPYRIVPWTYSIMRTALLDWVASEAKHSHLACGDRDVEAVAVPATENRPTGHVRPSPQLDGLSHHDADLLYLRHVVELSITDCASILGRSYAATRLHLWRATRRLRRQDPPSIPPSAEKP